MFKELLTCMLLPSLINGGVQTPYIYINQFVIYNNISDINFGFDSHDNQRNFYTFYAWNGVFSNNNPVELGYDNNGLFLECESTTQYLYDLDNNLITTSCPNWEQFFNGYELGYDFAECRSYYQSYWYSSISQAIYDLLYDNLGYSEFGISSSIKVQTAGINDEPVPLSYIKPILDYYNYSYDISIGLRSYTYSQYANYNFEFSGYANGSLADNGPIGSIQGDESYSYHTTSDRLSSGHLIINFTNNTNLDYMRQQVLDDYPYKETLELITSRDFVENVLSLEQENSALKAQISALQEQLDLITSGNDMQVLIWTIAGTPWESFKHIWNVEVLGVNISGFVTGLITALIIVWIVKKLFK